MNNKYHFQIESGHIKLDYDYTFEKSKDFSAVELSFDVDNFEYKIEKWNDDNKVEKLNGIGIYQTKIKPNGKIINNFRNLSTKKEKPIAEENMIYIMKDIITILYQCI